MKNDRQNKILDIIATYDVETQEDLIARLENAGFHTTQATVSRDIRELKLVKTMTVSGAYKYTRTGDREKTVPKFNSALADSVTRVDYAGNLVVVHTYPGMAQPVASCIDGFGHDEVLGCVGGDDTVIVVIRDAGKAEQLCGKIRQLLHTI